MKKEKDIYTIPYAARICSVGRSTMWRWVKSGNIRASVTPGGQYRILKEDLESFLSKSGMRPMARRLFPQTKILIVDDDTDVQNLLFKILSAEKYKTDVASDGFEAGIKVMQFKPDLIILDLFMPRMDGFEVCRRIKEDADTAHIKILAITGYDREENRERIMASGADGFMAKPMSIDILLKQVEALLNNKH